MTEIAYQFMPPLSPEEYAALEQSIRENGIQVPILLDDEGRVIDGHHRQKIASELGVACPQRTISGKSEAELRTLALSLNLDRRHLNREQRRALVAASLKADPHLSDRQHAERTGVSHPTVGAVRNALEVSGEVESFTTRFDSSGHRRPASQPPKPESLDDSVANSGITGLDGKTYQRPVSDPAPRTEVKPQRRPITDAFWSALYDLNKKAETLARLVEDDRFDRNRESIATRNLPQMRQTASTVAAVLAALENGS